MLLEDELVHLAYELIQVHALVGHLCDTVADHGLLMEDIVAIAIIVWVADLLIVLQHEVHASIKHKVIIVIVVLFSQLIFFSLVFFWRNVIFISFVDLGEWVEA